MNLIPTVIKEVHFKSVLKVQLYPNPTVYEYFGKSYCIQSLLQKKVGNA